MIEAEAKTKLCPVMSTAADRVMCEGAECALWVAENNGPCTVKATDRKVWEATGWSTNNEIAEDGTLVFYRPPSGHCRAGYAPPSA